MKDSLDGRTILRYGVIILVSFVQKASATEGSVGTVVLWFKGFGISDALGEFRRNSGA